MQQIFGGRPDPDLLFRQLVSDSYSYFYGSSQSASQIMRQNVTMNALKEGITSNAARNGDTANKIGTSSVAIAANYYNVPVYICAPTSTIDMNTATGADIHIEERPAEEVTTDVVLTGNAMAPEGVKVYNPAFDVTDHSLIAGIVTE